jgi:hypothetical protein
MLLDDRLESAPSTPIKIKLSLCLVQLGSTKQERHIGAARTAPTNPLQPFRQLPRFYTNRGSWDGLSLRQLGRGPCVSESVLETKNHACNISTFTPRQDIHHDIHSPLKWHSEIYNRHVGLVQSVSWQKGVN